MRTTVLHPVGVRGTGIHPALTSADGLAQVARAVETAGCDAIAFTEHPAPNKEWFDSGGHASLDPFTALSFCAAHTSRIRLMTYLLVLPYRNPLLTLKSAISLDVLSGGRLTLTVGAGYLEGEFAALGVDFDVRNELFDESLAVLTARWGSREVAASGLGFSGPAQIFEPRPVQAALPVLIGGNSRRSQRRAVELGSGWSPLVVSEQQSARNRTGAIADLSTLGEAIARVRQGVVDAGRDADDFVVQVDYRSAGAMDEDRSIDEFLDGAGRLAAVGVDSMILRPPDASLSATVEALDRFGREAIPHLP